MTAMVDKELQVPLQPLCAHRLVLALQGAWQNDSRALYPVWSRRARVSQCVLIPWHDAFEFTPGKMCSK